MASAKKTVFLIGPGYIGRAVVDLLLEQGYAVSALVRDEVKAKTLFEDGVKPIGGTLDDKATIREQTEASDIVIHTATADHLPSVEAVIEGIRERAARDQHTIYIHTSGASFLSDDSKSEYKSDMIYTDKKPEDLDARPESSSHRSIDLEIIAARNELETKAKIFIILPPLIYGTIAKHERLSIQIPTMARFAMKHKFAGHVGKGEAVWSTVHVADLARAYITILRWLETSSDATALEHPYFFCEDGQEVAWKEYAGIIGASLHDAGRIPDATPREIPRHEWDDLFGPYSAVVVGANSRCRAERVRELGWKPNFTSVKNAFETEELPLLLQETGDFNGYAGVSASGATD